MNPTMSLFDCIQQATLNSHLISFKTEINNISIRVSKKKIDSNGLHVTKVVTQMLPLREDHFNEQKIVACIIFCIDKLK